LQNAVVRNRLADHSLADHHLADQGSVPSHQVLSC
jgi:hypothetical protein